MPASISPILAPYLQSCLQDGSTTIVTSVLDTPSFWVVLRFINAAIFGVDNDAGVQQPSDSNDFLNGTSSVVFVSFLRPYEYWVDLGKKIGLDFSGLNAKNRLAYIDGLVAGLSVTQLHSPTITLTRHDLAEISHVIDTAKAGLSPGAAARKRTTLIVDGLDLVLASQPEITASHLNTFLTNTRDKFDCVVLTASADSPLIHNIEASATPLELDHSIFVRATTHQSTWALQLRPLETGHAKDVSGVIQISRGGADPVDDGEALSDGEWLYQVKGDGSVRIWTRGE